ncbi:Uncharacterized protein FWK35_00006720 [Aphis craccivora]|uniref:Transmembrane protein n=1 Tax=Aphis craccivora TaxID=307492 RepID=A0A6G0ZJY3_APHCR|nr:Uncharacterized protein FWK35_00006720 [Aphis craccivora]
MFEFECKFDTIMAASNNTDTTTETIEVITQRAITQSNPIFLQTTAAQVIAGLFVWTAVFVTCQQNSINQTFKDNSLLVINHMIELILKRSLMLGNIAIDYILISSNVSNVVMIQGFGTNCQGELWLHPNVFSIYFLCVILKLRHITLYYIVLGKKTKSTVIATKLVTNRIIEIKEDKYNKYEVIFKIYKILSYS